MSLKSLLIPEVFSQLNLVEQNKVLTILHDINKKELESERAIEKNKTIQYIINSAEHKEELFKYKEVLLLLTDNPELIITINNIMGVIFYGACHYADIYVSTDNNINIFRLHTNRYDSFPKYDRITEFFINNKSIMEKIFVKSHYWKIYYKVPK